MKKAITITISIIALCLVAACSGDEPAVERMYIEPAQLTDEEQDIAELLGLNSDYLIYDFVLDGTAQSIQFNTYELENGEWSRKTGGGGQAFSDGSGRIALEFDRLPDGLRIALQSENSGGSTTYSGDGVDDDGMGSATSTLADRSDIAYEQEIPLVIQIITSKNEIHSYDVSYFEHPEEYAEYEHVYAVTVRFSQKTVSELSEF